MKIHGVPVIDATKKIVLIVSAKDVARGDTKDPAGCAAALACMRQMHAKEVRVHIGRTYVKLGNKRLRFKTSKGLRTEIVAFDRGGEFEPGEYTIDPMPKSDQLGRQHQRGPHVAKHGSRKTYHVVTGVRYHGANR